MTGFHFDDRLTRRSLGLATLGAAALGLVACSDDTDTTAQPSGSTTAAPASSAPAPSSAAPSASTPASEAPAAMIKSLDEINVSGAVGQMPTLRAAWPLNIAQTQSKVINPGTGAEVVDDSITVEVHYAGFNARTGQRFDDSFSRGAPTAFPLNQVVPGFTKGLVKKKVGDRVLIMMPSADGYPEGNPQAGINPGDALVFIVEIVSASLKAPAGTAVAAKPGLPTVKDNGAKAPTVTIGSAAKPTELVVQPLIQGAGRKVTAADTLTVNYTMVGWDGKVYAEDYTTGPEVGPMASFIEGWKQGLVNQTVGSRVLLLTPPALAYPKGWPEKNLPAGESLAFVIDILFANAAA